MYGIDAFDRQARRLARQIRAALRAAGDPAAAFRARLHMGGRAARLVAHDPRLPPEIWEGRRGLQELRDAFQRFEARIGPLADRVVDGALRSNESVRAERPRAVRKGAATRTGSAANSL